MELDFIDIQKTYYSLPESKERPIIFAISRPEDGREFLLKVCFLYRIKDRTKWVTLRL